MPGYSPLLAPTAVTVRALAQTRGRRFGPAPDRLHAIERQAGLSRSRMQVGSLYRPDEAGGVHPGYCIALLHPYGAPS